MTKYKSMGYIMCTVCETLNNENTSYKDVCEDCIDNLLTADRVRRVMKIQSEILTGHLVDSVTDPLDNLIHCYLCCKINGCLDVNYYRLMDKITQRDREDKINQIIE